MKSKTVTAVMKDGERSAVESVGTQPWRARAPTLEEIRQRAYELHLDRGCVHGRDQDDWLRAERKLMEKVSGALKGDK
jgi:Protein of unknown function (DUF2934)